MNSELMSYSLGLLCGIYLFIDFGLAEKAPDFTFIKEATSAPRDLLYDYIIIGGGAAGCPLAATLSQGSRVLVLERGGSPYSNPNKFDKENYLKNLLYISPTSFTQQFISTDGVLNARGRILGGSTVLTPGFYSRPESSFVKEAGWNETLVMESYQWVEKVVAFEPQVLQWQSAVRAGLLEAGVRPDNGFTYDHLYGTKIGGTNFDKEGHRHTAADLLKYADPTRISVYLHATVQKILFKYSKGSKRPKAYAVLFKDDLGVMHTALLGGERKSEIILCAGALGSPQILMLSGIGPTHHLHEFGINTVLHNPNVGQGMADNPANGILVPSPVPVEFSLIELAGITKFGSYIAAASGVGLTLGFTSPLVLERIFEMVAKQIGNITTISDQIGQPFMETLDYIDMAMKNKSSLFDIVARIGMIVENVQGPVSTGHLELRNTNPNDNPSVTFNYFKEPQDLEKCVRGMKTIIDIINSKSFSRFRYPNVSVRTLLALTSLIPLNLRLKHAAAAFSLEQYCLDTVGTIYHYHGGCLIGKVVDHDYKVLGVDALRVIDGSTFRTNPGTSPQATVMMLGRYMGKRILEERSAHVM